MTTLLYILLGISVGIGCTLIFLQERFTRERRRILATSKAEREKATRQLLELDEKWEAECEQYRQELAAAQTEAAGDNAADSEQRILEKESEIAALTSENQQLQKSNAALQDQLTEAQSESDYLKGEIKRLEKEKSQIPADDFIVLSPSGGHLLPGSIARALMKRTND
nr:hypothetical protein [Desulfobulbaceae bacterium]